MTEEAPKVIPFGEWTPDQPDLGGSLTEANNVIPDVGFYRPFKPLAVVASGHYDLVGAARGLYYAVDSTGATTGKFYAGTDTVLYMEVLQEFAARSGALSSSLLYDWQFAQYKDYVFACNYENTQYHTFGSGSNFVASAGPAAGVVGVIGDFVIVGDLNEATNRRHAIRWAAIGDPTDWPTPNTADATAKQAGEEELNAGFGTVQAIVGGDQYGLIFQEHGITRMTYAGPPLVFQFDEIERARGAWAKYSVVKTGQFVYFIAYDGFYVTDGVTTKNIGLGKVDTTFLAAFGAGDHARGFYDARRKCVVWSFPAVGSSTADRMYYYHIPTERWTRATETMRVIDTSSIGAEFGPYAFNSSNIVCGFTGTPGTATIATGDVEINPGGRALCTGIKPNVESSGTPPTVTVRVGARNDLNATPTYTSATSITTRTGFADVRVDAKYHRAEVSIVGAFTKATGIEALADESGRN